MKSFLSLFLALVIFLQPLGKLWIVASFELHQDYIVQVFCTERNAAENTCQGVCHLQKQLAAAAEQEKKQIPPCLKDKLELIYLYPAPIVAFEQADAYTPYTPLNAFYLEAKCLSVAFDIFHPPKV